MRPGRAVLTGLVWGVANALTAFYWITPLLIAHAGLCPAAAMGLALVDALFQSLFPLLFCYLASRSRPGPIMTLAALPFLWAGLEWLQGEIILKILWQPLGQALIGYDALIQTAELWGVTGLSIIALLINILIAMAISPQKSRLKNRLFALGVALILPAALALWGQIHIGDVRGQMTQSPGIQAMAVQAEQTIADLNEKPRQSPELLARLSCQGCPASNKQTQLIVWPESAAPYYLFTIPGDGLIMKYLALEKRCHLILGSKGVVRRGKGLARTNRAWLIGPEGAALGFYDKAALAPFGEYSPLGPLWLLELLAVDKYEFAKGMPGKLLDTGKYKIGPLICFEALVPELARQETANGARLFVNLSNGAWFISGASEQLLAHTRLRCVENRRACVQSSNMGLSAVIMPDGSLDSIRGAVLCGSVPLMDTQTLYTRFGWIWGPGSLILGAALLAWVWIRRRVNR